MIYFYLAGLEYENIRNIMAQLCVILLLSLYASKTSQDIAPQKYPPNEHSIVTKSKVNSSSSESEVRPAPYLNLKIADVSSSLSKQKKNELIVPSVDPKPDNKSNSYNPSIEPGADLRLVSVISLFALSCLLCICCKMYR